MGPRPVYLTQEGHKALQEELQHLRGVRRQEVAARIHMASETGGTVDNAEYDEAKNEQSFVEGRIREVETVLSSAIVTAAPNDGSGEVGIGSSVTVESADGAQQRYVVVGSAEAAPSEGKISNESPVGRSLLGRRAGDKVEVRAPSGVVTLTITSVG